jgi:hypothetical protein
MHSSDFAIKRIEHGYDAYAIGGTHAIASGYYYQQSLIQRDAVPVSINSTE